MPRGTTKARVDIGANTRKLDPDLRKARRKFQRFGKGIQRDLGRSFAGVRRSFGSIAGLAGVGGFAVVGRDVLQFEKKLTRLGIQAGKSDADMGRFRDRVRDVSDSTGIASADLLEGAAAFTSLTGDLDTANASLELFAKVSTATGADMSDITKTAAALGQQLGIVDPSKLEEAFGILIDQGKAGAIELRDVASLMSGLAPVFAQFGSTGVQGLSELGGTLQIVKKGFGTSAEAATALQGLMTALLKNSDKFAKAGVQVFEEKDGKKQLRNLREIVGELSAAGNSADVLIKTFGRAEGAKAFLQIEKALGNIGTDGKNELDKLINGFEGSTAVQKDFAKFSSSTAGQLAKTWQNVQNTFARLLTPARIQQLAHAFTKLADVAGFLADHLGTVVALMATAKMGPGLIKMAQMIGAGAIGQGAAGGIAGGAGGMGLKSAGVGGLVIAAGAAGVALGMFADEALGLSDKIAGVNGGKFAGKSKESQRLRGMAAAELDFLKAQGVKLGTMGAGGKFKDPRQQRIADMLAKADRLDFAATPSKVQEVRRGQKKRTNLASKGVLEAALGDTGFRGPLADPKAKPKLPENVLKLAREAVLAQSGGAPSNVEGGVGRAIHGKGGGSADESPQFAALKAAIIAANQESSMVFNGTGPLILKVGSAEISAAIESGGARNLKAGSNE